MHATPDADPISVASARLYARKVPASERMAILKLLGVLMDHADARGQVAFDADVLSAELEAGLNESHRYYRVLESVGVVARRDDGWRILGFRPSTTSVDHAGALDVLARHLERERDANTPRVTASPTASRPSPAPVRPVVVPIEAGRRRVALPALAGVAAAAVVAWMFALVNTTVGPTATQVAVEQPLAKAASRQPGTIMLAAPAPLTGKAAAAAAAGQAASDGDPATAGGRTQEAAAAGSPIAASCAPGRPRLRIDKVEVVSADQAQAASGSDVQPGWLVLVTGTLENVGGSAIEVRSFDVEVESGDDVFTTKGVEAPVLLPAATKSPWTTILYAGRTQPSDPRAHADLGDWAPSASPSGC